jgi:hypothetical protein
MHVRSLNLRIKDLITVDFRVLLDWSSLHVFTNVTVAPFGYTDKTEGSGTARFYLVRLGP